MKKKGFTLIELLAVIVILAIIALIATPMIMDVIEKSKRGAAIDSAYGYLEALEQYIIMQDMQEYEVKIESDKIYQVESDTTYNEIENVSENYLNNLLSFKGQAPTDGYVELEQSKMVYGELDINGYHVVCKSSTNCEITERIVINATDIAIVEEESEASHVIGLQQTLQLHVRMTPTDATSKVKWSSSNETVATVSTTGLVTPIANGTTTITAQVSKSLKAEFALEVNEFVQEEKIYLYFRGKDNTDLTGGYIERNQGPDSQISFKNDKIYMNLKVSSDIGRKLFTKKKIDITNYKQLRILYNATAQSSDVYNTIGLGIADANTSYTTPATKSNTDRGLKIEETILTLDISDIKGEYYIYISAGSLKPYIYEIWLER